MQLRSFPRRVTRRLGTPVFDLLGDTGLRLLFAPSFAGRGVIFTLHRVTPSDQPIVYPGYATPTNLLEEILRYVLAAGWDIVSLDEMVDRLEQNHCPDRRFACFTFDDGYLDNYTLALPIFERYRAPF